MKGKTFALPILRKPVDLSQQPRLEEKVETINSR
jgi:hypothetical protein